MLLRLLRAQPGLSRARLAAESGLTKSTVSLLVRELIDEGWLERGRRAGGRRARAAVDAAAIDVGVRALIGVEIAVEMVRVVCVSLQGEVLHADAQPLTTTRRPAVCAQVARMVRPRTRHLAARGCGLSGIGVCVPGAVDDATGVVRFAPNLGWRNVTCLPALDEALGRGRPAGRRGAVAERRRCGGAGRVRVRAAARAKTR